MTNSHGRFLAPFWFIVIGTLGTPSPSAAQVFPGRVAVPGESRATANRMAATAKLVADKQWSEAIDEYSQIQDESGDDLVPLDSWHSISARRLCQQQLAALPPEALRLYRDRVESQAKKWFEQGKAEREPRLLRRLVDEAFCSRYTDRGLDLLGDLAFERGRFEEAETWWNMLAPPPAKPDLKPRSLDLTYPGPQIDLSRVRAKQLLARLFAGNRDYWTDDLKAFRTAHGNAHGDLAGQTGKYADILETIFNQPGLKKALDERNSRPRPWPTFAGDSSHNFIAPQAPKRLAYESPPWPIRLKGQPSGNERPQRMTKPGNLSISESQPKYHPVIAGDLVFIADAHSVAAYDVLTARRLGSFNLQSIKKPDNVADHPSASEGGEYALTVAENRVYAVLGNSGTGLAPKAESESVLVCLDLPPQSDGQFHLRWHRVARNPDGGEKEFATYWEGPPIVGDNQVFIARTRVDKNPGLTSVECYDADSGMICWRQEVCRAAENTSPDSHHRTHVLTRAGLNLVYSSDTGVIVALDAASGRRTWACRYASRGLKTDNGDPAPRGLSPLVYHSGRVHVAPTDFDGLLCLDALTGEKIWERKPIEVVHLMGVAKGRLILTTAKSHWPAGIRALDAETGVDLRGWIQPEDSSNLLAYGRGFLAGDLVYWPTLNPETKEKGLYILNQDDGQPAIDPSQYWQVRCGNMSLGHGCLAVADDENLYVYVPPARLLEQRTDQARNSLSATAQYYLALAQADADQSTKALETFARAARLVQPNETWGNKSLLQQIHEDWHQHLLSLADKATRSHDPKAAGLFFEQTANTEFSVADRLRALAHQAEGLSPTDSPRAIGICKSILQDDALRRSWLVDANGTRHQARWWAAEKINRWAGTEDSKVLAHSKSPIPNRDLFSEKLGKSENEVSPGDVVPHWKLPLTPSWQISLDRGETFLGVVHSSDRCLFTCRGRDLICREFMTDRPRWVQRLGDNPNWLATYGDFILVASSKEIDLLSLANGSIQWELSAPPAASSRERDEADLHDFRLVGTVLIFFQRHRHLFGMDVQTGRVMWQRQAPGASLQLPPPDGRFRPNFYAGEKGVLVQTSGGRLWIVDPVTGKSTYEGSTSRSPWPRPPVSVEKDRVALIQDVQHVFLLNLPAGKVLWKKTLGQPSITAQAPQLLWNGQSLFQLSDGWSLVQLDLVNGASIVEKAISTEPINAELAALDSDGLYYVNRGVLQARTLTAARLLWEQPLPRSAVPWRVVVSGKYLFLMPSQPPCTLRWGFFLNPQPMSFPVEMQWDDVLLLICDKMTGKIVQKLNFHDTNEHAKVQLSNRVLVVAREGEILAYQPTGVR